MEEVGVTQAVINKIQTTIDDGIRLTLDIYPDKDMISKLMDIKMRGDKSVIITIMEEG